MTDGRFEELITAYLDGEIVPTDLAELHRAVRAFPTYRQRFQADSRLHVLMREAYAEQIELAELHETAALPPRRRLIAVAACVGFGLLLTGLWAYRHVSQGGTRVGTCLYVTGSGQAVLERRHRAIVAVDQIPLRAGDQIYCDGDTQAMLRLQDGTVVSMEPHCRLGLTLPTQPLQVHIAQGEALFEVAERTPSQAPFQIQTPHGTVEVHGTTFTLDTNEANTRLNVYEGQVRLTRTRDGASIEVLSEQTVDTSPPTLVVTALDSPTPPWPVSVLSLLPTDTATLDRGRCVTSPLKVEGGRRTTYLRFDIPPVGVVTNAKLSLTQTIDPGSGTLTFATGSHSDWSEATLNQRNAPRASEPAIHRTGVVQRRETIEVDVSSLVRDTGPITFVVDLDRSEGYDIWFHARKSDQPPQLILTYLSKVVR